MRIVLAVMFAGAVVWGAAARGAGAGEVNAGTEGAGVLAAPEREGAVRLVLAGALPDSPARQELGRAAGLLRPVATFLLGDELGAVPAGGSGFEAAVQRLHADLDPGGKSGHWYPCVGREERAAGENAYQQRLGPLYYAIDLGASGGRGGMHVVVLDSEETLINGRGISDGQVAWLKDDLDRVFERRGERAGGAGTRAVMLLAHRALWENPAGREAGNWDRVEALVRAFNRKPIVSVEGMGGSGGGDLRAPHVVAVIAGADGSGGGEYRDDGLREGVRYLALGPAAGEARDIAGPAQRGIALVTLGESDAPAGQENGGGGPSADLTVALVSLQNHASAGDAATVMPADTVSAQERGVAEAVERWSEQNAGLEVVAPAPGASTAPAEAGASAAGITLEVHVSNPLKIPVAVSVRAGASAVSARSAPATEESLAGALSTAFDESRWQIAGGESHALEPGGSARWQVVLTHAGGLLDASEPAVDLLVRWHDDRGRAWQVTLHRGVSPAGSH